MDATPPPNLATNSKPSGGTNGGLQTALQLSPTVQAPEDLVQWSWAGVFPGPAVTAIEAQALRATARLRMLTAGEPIFSRGQQARVLVLLLEGSVSMGVRGSDNAFQTERLVRGPGWCDLTSAWLNAVHAVDAQALGHVTLVELDPTQLRDAIDTLPILARRFITALARELQNLSLRTDDLLHKDAPARFAAWLVQRMNPEDANAPQRLELRERKRDIASQLAITPETLSRLIRSFTRRGIVSVTGYTVLVLDPAALRALADS